MSLLLNSLFKWTVASKKQNLMNSALLLLDIIGLIELDLSFLLEELSNSYTMISLNNSKILCNFNKSFIRSGRKKLFKAQLEEIQTEDILQKALVKAKIAYSQRALSAVQYYKKVERVKALKKLRFTEHYEKHQDPELYQWMKYKVAAEIGSQQQQSISCYENTFSFRQRQAFKKFQHNLRVTKGDKYLQLWRQHVAKDPQENRYLTFF